MTDSHDSGPTSSPRWARVDAIISGAPSVPRRPPIFLFSFEEMSLLLYIHKTMRRTQNCSWLKVGAIGETCGKRCMREFCKLLSYRMREAFLPKPCRKCGQDHTVRAAAMYFLWCYSGEDKYEKDLEKSS